MPRTRLSPKSFSQAMVRKNRVTSLTMDNCEAKPPTRGFADPLAKLSAGGNMLVIVLIFLACAAATLAFLSAQASDPFVLTTMGVLATLGVFFLFGVAAGHIRLSERATETEILGVVGNRIDDGVLLTSLNGQVIFANEPAARHLGHNELGAMNSLEEALGASQAGAETLFRLSGLVKRGESGAEEVLMPASLGDDPASERWLRVSAKPYGHIDIAELTGKAAIWTFTDVTQEKLRARRTRRGLETRLDLFEHMPAGLLRIDALGRLTFVSDRIVGWLDLDPDHTDRGLRLADVVAGDGAELLQTMMREETRPAVPPRVDLDLVRRDGRRWPATLILQAAPDEAHTGGFSAVVLAREELDADDASLELTGGPVASLFQSAPFGIASLAEDGRIIAANAAFSRLLMDGRALDRHTAFDVLTKHVDDEQRTDIKQALEAAVMGKANISPVEIAFGQDGEFTRRVFFYSLAAPAAERGPVVLYVTDATEEKALGAKFAQSQKMEAVGKLAGGIAHDFNNVLTAIIGFSDLLMTSHRPGDHAYKNIQNIRSSANHAAGLVKQLLAFSRRQTLTTKTLQLNEVVTDLSVILNRLLGENVELKIKSGRDIWPVRADQNQLNQVIINLAVNARDAMPEGGRLTVRTRNVTERESQRRASQGMAIGQYVMFEVEDTGTGMTPEVLKNIFEPFFTTKDIGKGTGLGLSTVYGIIKQTGGYVFAESEPGIGTTFQVYLPRYIETEEEIEASRVAAAAKTEAKPRDLTGKGRVLVVEDEDAVRMFAVEALKRQGYEVFEACDGFDALEIMEDHDYAFDLVVSDVKMPEMDGPTLYKELRKAGSDVKFIFVSGYADDAFAKQLEPGDQYTFMPKPYTLAQIAEKVKEQLS
jgi:two-component system, cell cycle sensor histidine kinase and response regulator CckA